MQILCVDVIFVLPNASPASDTRESGSRSMSKA